MKRFRIEQIRWLPVQYLTFMGLLCTITVSLLVACGMPPTAQSSLTLEPTSPTTASVSTRSIQTSTPDHRLMPPPRSHPQFAYDGKTGTFLLFGGFGFNGELNDTWTWDGTTWTQQYPITSPTPRSGASMVYDAATGQMVLFGGCTAGCNGVEILGDTWTWDGTTWTQQHPAILPPARLDASMTYDAATQTVLLFGGGGTGPRVNRSFPPLRDMWSWNGRMWMELHPLTVPSARLDASMTYDSATRTVVLFGGNDASEPSPLLHDTWTWDGTTWMQQHPATSPPSSFTNDGRVMTRFGSSMTYDTAAQQIVLALVGRDDSGSHKAQESWTWDGTTWIQQIIQSPSEDEAFIVYDATQQTVFEFTSTLPHTNGFIDKLWKWTGQGWKEMIAWS